MATSSDRVARPGVLGGLFDLSRSPAIAVVHRALGNLGWPILLKEIRADFRKNRFFITHLVCLSVLAIGILWQVTTESGVNAAKAESIGRGLFNVFFTIQFLVVIVVFPSFSSSALSEERALQTFDLLVTTDLRPAEIVWGKFLASSVYCLIYIIATVPLLAVSLLFAGVTLWEIGVAYLILIGLTVFLSMAGLFASACFRSTVRATICMYCFSFGILAFTLIKWGDVWWAFYQGQLQSTLVRALVEKIFDPIVRGDLFLVLLALLWVAWLFAVPFTFLFLLAANRLKARSDDRTSKIRMLAFAVLLPTIAFGYFRKTDFGTLVILSGWLLFLLGLISTAEEPRLSMRLRLRFAGWKGVLAPLRIFVPGSFWGLIYSAAITAVTVGFLAVLWAGRPPGVRADGFRYGECLATLPIYLFAFQAMGFFLSAAGFTPAYTGLTVAFVFVITTLLPVIFQISGHPDGLLAFYYLSPVTLWNSLDPDSVRPGVEGPRYLLYGAPVIRVAQVLFATLGVAFAVLGIWTCRRKKYPLLRLLPSGDSCRP